MDDPNLLQGLILMVVGMSVVLMSLMGMAVLLSIGGWALSSSPEAKAPAPAPAPALAPSSAAPELSGELLAVLTAAAYAVVKKPIRVRQVVMLAHHGSAWVAGGRATIMGSHRPHMHKSRSAKH